MLSRFLAGLAVVGLFLALGRYNQVYSLYARWPVVNLFRIPSRYILLTQFALSAGAALAVDDLRKRSRILPFPVGAWILGGAMAVMSLATAALAILLKLPVSFSLRQNYPSLAALAEHVAPAGHVIGGAVLAIVGACLFLVSSRLPSVAQNGLVIFVLLDVLAIQGAILARHEYGDPFQIAETRRPPVPAPGPIQAPPIDDLPSILGYQLVNGYSGLNPAMLIPMHSRAYATLMGARVYWDDGWKAMPSPLSTLRVRHEAIAFNTPGLLLADIDFGKTALVEESVNLDPDATGQLQWIENTPGKLRLSGQATGNVLGTIGVRFHRGWKMTLDGQRHSILRVDGILLGFTLPAGQHEIELRFEPDDFYLGGRLTLLGIGGLVLYFLLGFYQGVLFT